MKTAHQPCSVNRSFCRQVLDCGEGVFGVTAFALAALKIPHLAAYTAAPTQSGDSEDSVAAVQDASRPPRPLVTPPGLGLRQSSGAFGHVGEDNG